jgi:hypothetical protein
MAQNNDLSLGAGLIRKGQARGASPAMAVPQVIEEPLEPEPVVPVNVAAPAVAMPRVQAAAQLEDPDPPLRALPPDDVPKRFTSFRLPVTLDEDLRAMMYETRRSKQDLLIDFVTAGVQGWRKERAKR